MRGEYTEQNRTEQNRYFIDMLLFYKPGPMAHMSFGYNKYARSGLLQDMSYQNKEFTIGHIVCLFVFATFS